VWIMTQNGFYSVIAYEQKLDRVPWPTSRVKDLVATGQKLLLVRGRSEDDMKYLVAQIPGAEYAETNGDYLYRAVVTEQEWTVFMAEQTEKIDYGNFKNRITQTQGSERHDIYMSVWSALFRMQPFKSYKRDWPKSRDTLRRDSRDEVSRYSRRPYDDDMPVLEEDLECMECSYPEEEGAHHEFDPDPELLSTDEPDPDPSCYECGEPEDAHHEFEHPDDLLSLLSEVGDRHERVVLNDKLLPSKSKVELEIELQDARSGEAPADVV
jgi:hypothetical protein